MANQRSGSKKGKSSDNSTLCAALSYFLIGLIWYLFDPEMRKDRFVKFHVKQSLALMLVAIVYGIVVAIISVPLVFVPIFGWIVIGVLQTAGLLFIILAILGVIHSVNQDEKMLPVIGHYSKIFKF